MKTILIIIFLQISSLAIAQDHSQQETVLDEVVTIYDEIVYDVPEVPRWCERLGFKNKRVDIGDAELYVETEGDGVPMVLLHGGPGGTHHYFHPQFSRASNYAQVIYYDQRGCVPSILKVSLPSVDLTKIILCSVTLLLFCRHINN